MIRKRNTHIFFKLKKPVLTMIDNGANSHGQLGQGLFSEVCSCPTEVNLYNSTLRANDIVKIAGGGGHVLILTLNGDVYSCGWNNKRQTGLPSTEDTTIFQQIPNLKLISDIACGWSSSAAIKMYNELYIWGSNIYKKLFTLPNEENICQPYVATQLDVKKAKMGVQHAAIVYTNKESCLINNSWSNQQSNGLKILKDVINVSCGERFTIFKDISGNVYGYGDNRYCQLGIGTNNQTVDCIQIPIDSPDKIYTGWTHTAVLKDGSIYAWGRNTYGQVDASMNKDIQETPYKVCFPERIKRLAVGAAHNVALTESGKVLCWGWNEHGICGFSEDKKMVSPLEAYLKPVLSNAILVGAGAGFSFALVRVNGR
ncbi:secretion-regulating guanine nucleotide exchange factor-like [Prorops nasuta]|uniref:secretion-regulating guanine nucleotide exchange factor-like n=1 Tax=Prorops nasuta TaxID=863751 RepID=UPI0034CD23B5